MFEAEAKKLRDLRHNNIPRLHAFFKDENDNLVLVMEHISGKALNQVLAETVRHKNNQLRLIW